MSVSQSQKKFIIQRNKNYDDKSGSVKKAFSLQIDDKREITFLKLSKNESGFFFLMSDLLSKELKSFVGSDQCYAVMDFCDKLKINQKINLTATLSISNDVNKVDIVTNICETGLEAKIEDKQSLNR